MNCSVIMPPEQTTVLNEWRVFAGSAFGWIPASDAKPVPRGGHNLRRNAADTRVALSNLARLQRAEEPVH